MNAGKQIIDKGEIFRPMVNELNKKKKTILQQRWYEISFTHGLVM